MAPSTPTAEARPAAPALPAKPTAGLAGDRPRLFPTAWFALIHLACLGVLWTGASWAAVGWAALLYAVRMFAVTAGYHRLLSHRSYETSRPFAFVLAALACTALQKGPLWWASVHRHHHRWSDQPQDAHSPVQRGFWWAHIGWILAPAFSDTDASGVPDLAARPELRLLERFHWLPPLLLGAASWALGAWLEATRPDLGATGLQFLVWGMAVSTVVGYHATWSVNSVVHIAGRRRFATPDQSRNNLWVALYTFGEGWHNNHHRYQASERQGFYRWEVDATHRVLWLLSQVRLVWNLKRPSAAVLAEGQAGGRG